MGISGLLPTLSSIEQSITLRKFQGQRLAVDTYVLLHKGLFSCAGDLCMNIKTTK